VILTCTIAVVLLAGIGATLWLTVFRSDDSDSGPRRVATGGAACRPAHAERTAECPFSTYFDPAVFAEDHGASTYPCNTFASQADAQAVLRANPADPNHLSRDLDGVACRGGFAPTDFTPVRAAAKPCTASSQRTARCPRSALFEPVHFVGVGSDVAYHCSDFASQADAQAVLRAAPTDPDKLDPTKSGVACPDLPAPKDTTLVARG
jgi:hypothetical protein